MWTVLTVLAVLALGLAAIFLRSSDEPRFQGRTVSYYFPAWVSRSDSEDDFADRFKGDADPGAIPFLVEAVRWLEDQPASLASVTWDRIPGFVRSILPLHVDHDARVKMAYARLARLSENPSGLRQLRPAFGRLSPEVRIELLWRFQQQPKLAPHLDPLLQDSLTQTHPDVRWAAARYALRFAEDLPEASTLALRFLESAPETSWTVRLHLWQLCLASLSAQGTNAAAALPLLDRLSKEAPENLNLLARLAALRIRDPDPDLVQFFEENVRHANVFTARGAIHSLIPTVEETAQDKTLLRSAERTLPLLIHMLSQDFGSPAPHSEDSSADPATFGVGNSDVFREAQIRALARLTAMGPKARPAAAAAVGCLESPARGVRQMAGQFLGKLGPAAPEVLPEMIAAMREPDLHDTLIPLLAAYGPLASNALPDLQALAAGQWRSNWLWHPEPPDNRRPMMDPILAKRYGLKIEASAEDSPETDSAPPAPTHLGPDPRNGRATPNLAADPVVARRYGLRVEGSSPPPASRRERARQAISRITPTVPREP